MSPPPLVGSQKTFREVLLVGCRLMPAALIDTAGWEQVLQRVGDLPAGPTPLFGFEFELGKQDPGADFFVCVYADSPILQSYIQRGRRAAPDSADAAFARYLSAMHTKQAWFGEDDLIQQLIFEYDVIKEASAPDTLPGLFIKFRSDASATVHARRSVVAASIREACGWEQESEQCLALLNDVLPEQASISYAGAFPGRPARAMRLILRGIPMTNIVAFLQRLRWPGRGDLVEAVLARLQALPSHASVAIDMAPEGVGPRLGLEISVPRRETPAKSVTWLKSGPADWDPLLAQMERAGWCRPDKGQALRASLGQQQLWSADGLYHAGHGLNHIKVLIHREQISAKAYTGMFLRMQAD